MFQVDQWSPASRKQWVPQLTVLPRCARLLSLCLSCCPWQPPQPNHAVCPAAGRHTHTKYSCRGKVFEYQFNKLSLCCSRLIPHLLWRTFLLSLTVSPTTLQAQETLSPSNQAYTLSWAGSETCHIFYNIEYIFMLTSIVTPFKPFKI